MIRVAEQSRKAQESLSWTQTVNLYYNVTSSEVSLSKACRNSSWSAWICSILGFFTEFIIADEAG